MTPPPKLSLEALVVLDAVARHLSFAKAAAELHKVPSAMSYTVGQLEAALGVQLFDRVGRKLKLTATGAQLLMEGRRLLGAAHDVERRVAKTAAGWEPELRLAVDTIFGLQALFPLLPAFDALHTGTRLSLREEALGGCWDALESGRTDLIIAGLGAGGVPAGGGYEIHILGSLSFDYAVAAQHPLAQLAAAVRRPLTEDELHPFRAVCVGDSSLSRPLQTIGLLSGQETLTVATMRDKLAAQLAGLGVGFLPHFLAAPEFERGSLVCVPVVLPRPQASFCAAHRPGTQGQAARWFMRQLRDQPALWPMLRRELNDGPGGKKSAHA